MNDLFTFARQWLLVVATALLPVLLTAFVTIPWNLAGDPSERPAASAGERHMT